MVARSIVNGYVVSCEARGCKKELHVKDINHPRELRIRGWGWGRGDSAYDHYCDNPKHKAAVHRKMKRQDGTISGAEYKQCYLSKKG